MPVIVQQHRVQGNLPLYLGAYPRPRDPNEDKYHFARLVQPRTAVNLNTPKLLSDRDGKDHRIPITNQGAMGCHDEQTEVLTECGWQRWSDWNEHDRLGTINPLTGYLEFQTALARQIYRYQGTIYTAEHNRLNFALTPNHRMYVRKWNESDRTLSPNFVLTEMQHVGWYAGLLNAPRGWLGTELTSLTVGNRTYDGDDFLALLALIISDGWAGGQDYNRNNVSFCCFDERYPTIQAFASRLGLPEVPSRRGVWQWRDAALAAWLRVHAGTDGDTHAEYKRIPTLVKCASQRQIEYFLNWYGDQLAHPLKGETRQFYTGSKYLASDLQELMLRIGKRGGLYERSPRRSMIDGRAINGRLPDITITEAHTDTLSLERKRQVRQEDYDGYVYCATVPNGLLVTRREGQTLISGNSCVAFTTLEVNGILSSIDTGTPVLIEPGWLYEQCRKKEGTWPNDAGSYEADALDIMLASGAPLFSAAPYVAQANYDYNLTPDPKTNFVATHMPFHVADGNVLENIWTAIDQDQPVAIALAWLNPFFNPSGGKLPDGVNPADVAGGHEVSCFGIIPGFVLCSNHWTTGWSADAANFGYTLRPGDFAIPWSYFQAPAAQNIIWELRAVTAKAIQPVPPPTGNCTQPALNVADPVVNQLKQQTSTKPLSRPAYYRVQGAQQVRDTIAGSGI